MDFSGYKKPSVPLSDVIHEFDLEVLNAPEGMEHLLVESDDINRPGLQLTGFFDYFDPNHLQICGNFLSGPNGAESAPGNSGQVVFL